MSGAWDDRGCTSNPADGSILHGNSVGRTDVDLPWEKLDKVDLLKKYL